MEKKTTTYGELKQRKAELRDEMEAGTFTELDEYRQVVQAIKDAELELLWGITPNESYGELPRVKKCRKAALVSFAIAGIAAVILIFGLFGCNVAREGCHLIGAAGQDVGWMANKLGDNITTEK